MGRGSWPSRCGGTFISNVFVLLLYKSLRRAAHANDGVEVVMLGEERGGPAPGGVMCFARQIELDHNREIVARSRRSHDGALAFNRHFAVRRRRKRSKAARRFGKKWKTSRPGGDAMCGPCSSGQRAPTKRYHDSHREPLRNSVACLLSLAPTAMIIYYIECTARGGWRERGTTGSSGPSSATVRARCFCADAWFLGRSTIGTEPVCIGCCPRLAATIGAPGTVFCNETENQQERLGGRLRSRGFIALVIGFLILKRTIGDDFPIKCAWAAERGPVLRRPSK